MDTLINYTLINQLCSKAILYYIESYSIIQNSSNQHKLFEIVKTTHYKSDNNNTDHDGRMKNLFAYQYQPLLVEQEIMALYTQQLGYDPREPQTYTCFSEEETIERHAENLVFGGKLNGDYNVKGPQDIHKVKSNVRWQYITENVMMWR